MYEGEEYNSMDNLLLGVGFDSIRIREKVELNLTLIPIY
jgi:hypothetical protein